MQSQWERIHPYYTLPCLSGLYFISLLDAASENSIRNNNVCVLLAPQRPNKQAILPLLLVNKAPLRPRPAKIVGPKRLVCSSSMLVVWY